MLARFALNLAPRVPGQKSDGIGIFARIFDEYGFAERRHIALAEGLNNLFQTLINCANKGKSIDYAFGQFKQKFAKKIPRKPSNYRDQNQNKQR